MTSHRAALVILLTTTDTYDLTYSADGMGKTSRLHIHASGDTQHFT
ncbi:MAG: hypothetical protein M3Z35_04870 [Nitrospirota bacterium]|nr:hypothetical protein [Nitrospirota bacterium]